MFATAALNGCEKVEFPDVRLCSLAGVIAAGMDCSHTGHDEDSELDAKEMIDFLEGGAICMSAEDRKKEKTAAEQACVLLGSRCTFEMKKAISRMDARAKKK